MKGPGWRGILLGLSCLVVGALIVVRSVFPEQAASRQPLSVDRPAPLHLEIGESRSVDLYGDGFTDDLAVNLVMNVVSPRARDASLPLEGVFSDSLVVDGTLYLGSVRNGLHVVDVGNPERPRLRGEYLAGRSVTDIKQGGGFLYVACGRSGVVVMRILASGDLQRAGEIVTETPVVSLALSDDLLIAAGLTEVTFFRTSGEHGPIRVATLETEGPLTEIIARDGHLYVLGRRGTVGIYDIERRNPVRTGAFALPAAVTGACLFRNQLIVATAGALYRYDLSSPRSPRLARRVEIAGLSSRIEKGRDRLYLVDSFSRLSVIDPVSLEVVDKTVLAATVYTLAEAGNHLLVAGLGGGLQVLDRSRIGGHVVRTQKTPGGCRDILAVGRWLYIADTHGGILLKSLDRWNDAPVRLSGRPGESFYLDRARNLLFVALGTEGVEVFDVSDPGKPVSVAVWPQLRARKISGSGTLLFVSKGIHGIDRIETARLDDIRVEALIEGQVLDLQAVDRLLYVAHKDRGLQIYRIDRDRPVLLNEVALPFPMSRFAFSLALTVVGHTAYVSNGRSGLMTVDVRFPSKAQIKHLVAVPGVAKRVTVAGDRAYVSSQDGGVSVIDLGSFESPRLESHIEVQGLSRGLVVSDGMVYVAQSNVGVTAIPAPLRVEKVELKSNRHLRIDLPPVGASGSYDLQLVSRPGTTTLDNFVVVGGRSRN